MDGSVSELGEFGSERYGAPLVTSDIDKCFVLRPGQNRSSVFDRMIQLTAKDPEFTQKKTRKGRVKGDTFQFRYRGVFIDFKAMYTDRSTDLANLSSECVRLMFQNRPCFVRDAAVAFKLVLHHQRLIHQHNKTKGTLPKAICMLCFAVAVLDSCMIEIQQIPEQARVGFSTMAIFEAAVAFDWRTSFVFISRNGNTSILKKDSLYLSTDQNAVGIMFQCQAIGGTWGNGTNNVMLQQMDKMQEI